MCSTIENVNEIVQERLLSFAQEEIDFITKYLSDNEEVLRQGIANLKLSLRKAAINQFGITMYEILNLHDDYYDFMKSLENFNVHSYANALKKNTINIQPKLLDLDDGIQKYRQYCVNCGQVRPRRSKKIFSIHVLILYNYLILIY